MIKIVHVTALIALVTSVGLAPIAAYAQLTPNQITICNRLLGKASFKINKKAVTLKAAECRDFSGSTTFKFYTEYGDGTGARYSLDRQLLGGQRYKLYESQPQPKRLDIDPDPIIPT
jgi:hypothetical protein